MAWSERVEREFTFPYVPSSATSSLHSRRGRETEEENFDFDFSRQNPTWSFVTCHCMFEILQRVLEVKRGHIAKISRTIDLAL